MEIFLSIIFILFYFGVIFNFGKLLRLTHKVITYCKLELFIYKTNKAHKALMDKY